MHPIFHYHKPRWLHRVEEIMTDTSVVILIVFFLIYIPIYHSAGQPDVLHWISSFFYMFLYQLLFIFTLLICIAIRRIFYSEILSDNEGLHIEFFHIPFVIPWEDVIERKPLFNLFKKHQVIRVRSITPIHRIVGLIYSFTFHPCLIYSAAVNEHEELTRRVDEIINNRKISFV
jgi:hypothetical protein